MALRVRLLIASLLFTGLFGVATPAFAQTTSPTPSGSPSAATGPVLPSTTAAVVLVVVAATAIFLAWALPMWVDARRAYAAQREVWANILEQLQRAAAKDELSIEELKEFLPVVVRPAEGIRGLARVLMAFLVTSIVAVITLALLFSSATGVFEVIKQIVTALLGILATIIGFYFGARTAEGASSAAGASISSPTPAPTVGQGVAAAGGNVATTAGQGMSDPMDA